MHDLTTIQGDEPVGQRPYQTLPEAKKKTRASASESSGKYCIFFQLKEQFTEDRSGKAEIHLPHLEMEKASKNSSTLEQS